MVGPHRQHGGTQRAISDHQIPPDVHILLPLEGGYVPVAERQDDRGVNADGDLATERRGADQRQALDLPGVVNIGVDSGAFGSLAAAAVTDEHDPVQVDAAKKASSPRVATDGIPMRPQGEMVSDEL